MPDEPFGENVGPNPCIKRGTKISKNIIYDIQIENVMTGQLEDTEMRILSIEKIWSKKMKKDEMSCLTCL